MSIEPTPGRIVWYHPAFAHTAALAAIVVGIHSERLVNLTVFNDDGSMHPELEVTLLQDDDAAPADKPYAEWMPFQKGQAAKHDPAAQSAAAEVHTRLTEVENLLKTDGPIHGLFAQVTEDVAAKFQETGAFLEKKFGEIEQRLAHQPAPPPETPAAEQQGEQQPQPAADASAQAAAPQASA
jgi:hypothetical protein